MRRVFLLAIASAACTAPQPRPASPRHWPSPAAPAVPQADGYVTIPNVAVPPESSTVYRAIFDATRGAADPRELVPAVNLAGSELNALAACHVPLANAKFAIVFHGTAIAGLLDDVHYKARFRTTNPNLPVLAALKKAGVELFVCGQQLAADNVDWNALTRDVTIASDALIVLMTYHEKGYAILGF